MRRHLRPAVVLTVLLFVLLGLAYPYAETGLAQGLFHHQANGSLTANGSILIGQKFAPPRWFAGRPDPYDPTNTGPTNLGPTSKKLEQVVAARIAAWHRLGVNPTPDLVTSSGSGVDPDISPAGAYAQVPMVAKARGLATGAVERLVASHVHGPQWGFLGSSYVNVLELNEALAALR
ncbi:MAG: potassium-transporting ATPase subunit C [Acidimicrobiales bacterium]